MYEVNVENFPSLPSTQEYAKTRRRFGKDLIITADVQTGGRGTKGRTFSSNEGGVYLSKLTFYDDLPSQKTFRIMVQAAVSVCDALRRFGLMAQIKWPNDIFVNGKKISGILIENVLSGKTVTSSIVGIGLNVHNELPDELSTIATTMEKEGVKECSVQAVKSVLIEELSKEKTMEQYLSYLGFMGRVATLLVGDKHVHGTLLSVDGEGGLLVEVEGETRRFTAAEVTIKL